MTDEPSGKPPRKLPERGDALNVPLPFDDAIRAALETKPPPHQKPKRKAKVDGPSGDAAKIRGRPISPA